MPEPTLAAVLCDAEDWFEPDAAFVERLSNELEVAASKPELAGAPLHNKPRRRSLVAGAVAAGLALVVGIPVVLQPDTPAPAEAATASVEEAVASVPVHVLPVGLGRACDRVMFNGALSLGARVESTQRTVSSHHLQTAISTALLFDVREALGEIAASYSRSPDPNPVMEAGLATAIREFGLATLYVQMGEFAEAERNMETARTTLAGLTADPFFAACFGL